MKTSAAPQADTVAATLWRCGGRQCGAGECEHEENGLHRHASGPGPTYAPPLVHDVLRTSGSPLPAAVRADMEHRLGHDFADVRIHTDAAAAETAREVEAHAYTVGRHVVFAAGRFDPATPGGRRLLAHELSHAADAGPGTATPAGTLRISNPHDGAEQRASHIAGSLPQATPRAGPTHVATPRSPLLHRQEAPPATSDAGTQPAAPAAPPAATTPATCVPSRALTWADYTGTPPANNPYSAFTSAPFSSTTSGGRDWIVATFNGSRSWVKPQWRSPLSRATNLLGSRITECQTFFDGLSPGQTGWRTLPRTTGCAAAAQPDTTLRATSRGECESVLGTEADRVAVADSVRLLHHEQLHFDLACAMARKGNTALAASPAPGTQTILTAVRKKTRAQQGAYDTQTTHGCSAAGQSTWDTAVAQGLPSVTIP